MEIRARMCVYIRQEDSRRDYPPVWSHLGLNQGPPDYESGATNQLSYGTQPVFICLDERWCKA